MVYRKHTYMRLDGSSKISERRDMVADFQNRYVPPPHIKYSNDVLTSAYLTPKEEASTHYIRDFSILLNEPKLIVLLGLLWFSTFITLSIILTANMNIVTIGSLWEGKEECQYIIKYMICRTTTSLKKRHAAKIHRAIQWG